MIKNLKLLFLGFNITISTLSALDNPLKPIMEVLKASGVAQEKLKYTNDLPYLINNGNTWALIAALTLKYGYNPFGDKPFINLSTLGTAKAFKDYDEYSRIARSTYKCLIQEKNQNEYKAKQFEMGKNGVIQTGGSFITYKFLGWVIGPLKYVALAYMFFGAKKIYDAAYYQKYLENRIENNNYIENIIKRANQQLNKDVAEKAQDVIQQVQDLPQKIQDIAQKWKQKEK